jgi:hypothetical protein
MNARRKKKLPNRKQRRANLKKWINLPGGTMDEMLKSIDAMPELASYEICINQEFSTPPEQLFEKKTFFDGSVQWLIWTVGVAVGNHPALSSLVK